MMRDEVRKEIAKAAHFFAKEKVMRDDAAFYALLLAKMLNEKFELGYADDSDRFDVLFKECKSAIWDALTARHVDA